jgi:hypothetical protein
LIDGDGEYCLGRRLKKTFPESVYKNIDLSFGEIRDEAPPQPQPFAVPSYNDAEEHQRYP